MSERPNFKELRSEVVHAVLSLIPWPVRLAGARSLSDLKLVWYDLHGLCLGQYDARDDLVSETLVHYFHAGLSNMVPSLLWWPLRVAYVYTIVEDVKQRVSLLIAVSCSLFVVISYIFFCPWVITLSRVGHAMLICITVVLLAMGYGRRLSASPSGRRRRFDVFPPGFAGWLDESRFLFETSHHKDLLPSSHELTILIHDVTARILDAIKDKATMVKIYDNCGEVGKEDAAVAVHLWVVDRPYVQAEAYAGGKVIYFSGYRYKEHLPCDADVAHDIGHEIGHIIAEHNEEELNDTLLLCLIWAGLSFICSFNFGTAFLDCLLRMGLYFGTALLDYLQRMRQSRRHEKEADYLGFLLAASAGYDPEQQLLSFKNEDKWVEWFATHPCDANRITSLTNQQVLDMAIAIYDTSRQIH